MRNEVCQSGQGFGHLILARVYSLSIILSRHINTLRVTIHPIMRLKSSNVFRSRRPNEPRRLSAPMADPISVTGLALGIVPLLISAFENYEITFEPFVTYYRHVKEVNRFLTRLRTQRTIFQNECELLFTAVSDGTRLAEVLQDLNHPSRKDEEMSKRLEALLGSSYSCCVSLLNLINDTLKKITLETKGFDDLLEEKVCNSGIN